MDTSDLKNRLPGFTDKFYSDLLSFSVVKSFPRDQEILKEGSYVNVIPIVLGGLLKVTKKEEDKEILLYYIEKGQSCVMSFSACITNTQSRVFASTEDESELLLIPSDKLMKLVSEYPSFANYFFSLYQQRYEDLINSIDMLVFRKFDERLIRYLKDKCKITGNSVLRMTHQEIASDTGTLREVVSRTLKKLEKDSLISLNRNEIKVF